MVHFAGNRKLVKLCENRKHEFTQFERALSKQRLPSNVTSWTDLETIVQFKSFGPEKKQQREMYLISLWALENM